MKTTERLIGALAGLGFALLAFYAIFVVGALIYKGTGPAPAAFIAPAEPAATAAADTADAGADPAAEPAAVPEGQGGVDLAAGEKTFKQCKACHTIAEGGKNGTGPNLWGVHGRGVATAEGFAYSDALKTLAGQVWDQATLDAFLENPKVYAKGTKMAFAGVKKAGDRANLIAWLATQSGTPVVLAGAAPAADAPAAGEPPAGPYADLADDAVVTLDPVAYPEGVTYRDVPPLTEAELAALEARVTELEAAIPAMDYQTARYHPMHFSSAIETASSAECLACHKEIVAHPLREESPAGVKAADSLAWYQTLDTYSGPQADFHWRHLESDFAKQVMKLECTFCHKGNDPREESPDMLPSRAAFSAGATPEFTLRKMVNPSETCLLCHGAMPDPVNIMGLSGPWPEARVDMEYAEAPNGCLSCHAETFRTNRHQVNYLNAATIEDLARNGTSDTCYGCHGGRAWYRISYPYARTPWPGMDLETVPDWAAGRPAAPKPEHRIAQ
jgi:cytochrome c2